VISRATWLLGSCLACSDPARAPGDAGSLADTAPNLAPIAVVLDRSAALGERVELSGSESRDPEGARLRFEWSLRARPRSSDAVVEPTDDIARFVADRTGVFVVDLVVDDGVRRSPRATALVTVAEPTPPGAPIADAGPDRVVYVGSLAWLDGSGSSDPTGRALDLRWEVIAEPPRATAALDLPSTTHATLRGDTTGEYVVSLVADNGALASAPDLVRVTVLRADAALGDAVRRGVFDPAEVYLFGTLREGSAGYDAVVHYRAPDMPAVGFHGLAFGSAALGTDAELEYLLGRDATLRRFRCDRCPDFAPGADYPRDSAANDPTIATACDASIPDRRPDAFLGGPDGDRIVRCGGTWYDSTGEALAPDLAPIRFGRGRRLLESPAEGGYTIFDLETHERTPVRGLHTCPRLAVRSDAVGFVLVMECPVGAERWSIAADGSTALLGTYPPLPVGYDSPSVSALAADGRLVQIVQGPREGFIDDAIVERTIGGPSEVAFSEECDPSPPVRPHASSLLTGP
jgi:hypothetical protein